VLNSVPVSKDEFMISRPNGRALKQYGPILSGCNGSPVSEVIKRNSFEHWNCIAGEGAGRQIQPLGDHSGAPSEQNLSVHVNSGRRSRYKPSCAARTQVAQIDGQLVGANRKKEVIPIRKKLGPAV